MEELNIRITLSPDELDLDIEMIESLITLKLLRARFELMEYIEKARTIPMRSKKTS